MAAALKQQPNGDATAAAAAAVATSPGRNAVMLDARSWSPAHIYQEIAGYSRPSDKGRPEKGNFR